MQTTSNARNDQAMLLIAMAMLLLLTAVAMIARPITPVDETRYVGVAWEMWLRGDFLVPFKNGEPYSHKPPMMMWMFQTGWAIFGVNEWWPRMVSPLFSAGSMLLTFALAKRLWPAHSGLAGPAVIILASCLVWAISSTWVMFDVMLAFFVLLGIHGTLFAADGKTVRGFALLGLAIGLGVLSKGPVVLLQVLPVVVLAPWWHPGLRWGRWYGGMFAAIGLGALIALSWAIPAGIAGGDEYQQAIFWGQTANRMVESFAHQRPVWWYLALLPVLLFPWFVWPQLWRAFIGYTRYGLDNGGRFCIAWSVPVFVAFSFISGKQVHYLMPLFPAFALLLARATSQTAPTKTSGLWLPAAFMVIFGLGLVWLALSGPAIAKTFYPGVLPVWPGAVLVAAGVGAWFGRRQQRPVIVLGLLGAAAPALAQLALAPAIYPRYDVRPLAQAIHQVQQQGHPVAHAGKYHAQYHFFGRLEQPLVVLQDAALQEWLTQHPTAYAVIYVRDPRVLADSVTRVTQAYRGKTAVLLDAQNALGLLARPGLASPQAAD